MRKRWVWIVPAAIVGMVVFVFLGGTIVRLLWNSLLPTLFGFPQLTFWQALGILALCRILFGGFGMHGSRRSRFGRGERWERMTAEERARFRERMRARCGFGPEPDPFSTTETPRSEI